jgi:hypothetical protein
MENPRLISRFLKYTGIVTQSLRREEHGQIPSNHFDNKSQGDLKQKFVVWQLISRIPVS